MDAYPPIADHGLIGDLQTSALVSTDATIDWFCCPRFDSPSVFASLLDAQHGGHFSIRPQSDGYVTKQLYLPGTAILMTRFLTPDGVGEVCDFMPVINGDATDRHRLVRLVRVVRGEMTFVLDCQPASTTAARAHKTEITEDGVAFHGDDGLELAMHLARRPHVAADQRARIMHHGEGAHAVITGPPAKSAG